MSNTSKQAVGTGSRGRVLGTLVAVAALGAIAAVSVQAQEERTGRVIVGSANVRESCSMSAPVMGARSEGDRVEILETKGDWHRGRLSGGQEACMHESVLEVESTGAEESAAAVEAEPAERQQEIEAERLAAERAERDAALQAREASLSRQVDTAQRTESRAGGGRQVRGFLDLSYGVAWAASEDEEWQTLINPNAGGGVTDDRITYHLPRGDAFSIGGGVLFGQIGAGLRLSQQTHEDPADIHLFSTFAGPPFQVEALARTAIDLERKEQAAHLSFVYAPLLGEQFQLRLFVGPSYFDVEQDTVDDVFVTNPPRFEITGFLQGTQDDTAVGFHVGADASWYWDRFGVGLSGYYSQGEVEFRDRAAEQSVGIDSAPQKVDVGGVQLLGGLRLRF